MGLSRTFVALVVALAVLGGPLLVLLSSSPGTTLIWTAFAVLAALAASLVVERRSGSGESGTGSVWEFVPSEQYDGRFAEAGGITRGEQEAEIERIREEASKRR